jgi:hypothetical protein
VTTPHEAVRELAEALEVVREKQEAVLRLVNAGRLPRELDFPHVGRGTMSSPTHAMGWFARAQKWLAENAAK